MPYRRKLRSFFLRFFEQGKAESLALIQVELGDFTGKAAHLTNIPGPLRDGNDAPRIQQVKGVRALQHVVVAGQHQALFHQLLGFFLGWTGAPGRGRALGAGEIKLTGQVLPSAKLVSYKLDIRRTINRQLVLGIAKGTMLVDGKPIYECSDLRVGLFTSTDDF